MKQVLGNSGNGIFDQSGGTNTISCLFDSVGLYVGYGSGTGTYNLSGTSLLSVINGDERIGSNGNGTFNQTGGVNRISSPNGLYLGYYGGSSGNYTLSGSDSSLVAHVEDIGNGGPGTFTQNAGQNNCDGFNLGLGPALGTYTLNGGALSTGGEGIGYSGTGVFVQTGGTHTIAGSGSSGTMYFGYNSGSSGSYTLSGANSILSATVEDIGNGGTGDFTQNGGQNTCGGFNLGLGPSSGKYTLNDGTLSTEGEGIGYSGTGTFVQIGGTHAISDTMYIGYNSGSAGSYALSGLGSLKVGVNEYVGLSGAGIVTQNGGTNNLGGTLILAANQGASGTYNLQGGTLTAGAVIVNAGGTFTNSATMTLTGTAFSATPNGGNFTQNATGSLNVQINGRSSGQFGQLIAGTANLAGNISAKVGNVTPLSGDTFNFLATNTLTGTFNSGARVIQATSSITSQNAGQFNISYTNKAATLVYQPLLMLAFLSNNIYSGDAGYGEYSYVNNVVGGVDSKNLGYLANAYVSSDGSQVVVAIRGTQLSDPTAMLKNIAADVSFAGSIPSSLLVSEVSDAASFLKNVKTTYPNANITLTGHSLGGAVAQLLGKASGLDTIAFDAPGGQQLFGDLSGALQVGTWGVPVASQINYNYRLYGDQVSLIGTPIGTTTTIANPNQPPQLSALNIMGDFQYILQAHDLPTLMNQIPANLNDLPISTATAGQSPELNVAQPLQALLTGTPGGAEDYLFTFLVTDLTAKLIDPTGGTDFNFLENAGSPNIASVTLPTLDGVALYSLRYHQNGAWLNYQSIQPGVEDDFPVGTDGIDFSALDSSGNGLALSDFLFQTTFGSTGTVSATLVETPVPEPGSIMTLALGVGMLLARRRKP